MSREEATLVRRVPTGYLLAAADHNVDSHRLRTAAATVPELLAAGDARPALSAADDALSRWRGRPFAGVPDAAWMDSVRARLDALRMTLQELRVQALLDVGQPERAVSDIVELLEAEPFRERLWTQQMLGLYRCGRQSEALATFTQARRILVDEFGIEPGPQLREMRDRVLQQDQVSTWPGGREHAHHPIAHPPRRAHRSQWRARPHMRRSRPTDVITLTGPGGVGKTRLAIEVAWLARASFLDGVWFVPLADVTDPTLVWSAVAATMRLVPRQAPTFSTSCSNTWVAGGFF